MPIGKILLELDIPHAHSLKDRRQVVRSLKDKLRRHFNVSVAELDEALAYNRVSLGLVAISASMPYLQGQFDAIERAIHAYAAQSGAEVLDLYAEVLHESG
ncbi:MAG TPA: DUF503 domain-containing protein [Granulicella sp.]|jgi:uncharacterized protein YlxP (DUF503 family)|nr:DUF503 domain-containing protein [Granulicella sp.]